MYFTRELFYLIHKINSYENGITGIIKYFTNSFTFTSNKQLKNVVNKYKKDKIQCEKMYGSIKYWDTSKITDMSHLFEDFRDFNEDISRWNVSKVINMSYMFGYAKSFNQKLEDWDISNVVRMSYMFFEALSFKSKTLIRKWTIPTIKYNDQMFYATDFS
jgi:surface protein